MKTKEKLEYVQKALYAFLAKYDGNISNGMFNDIEKIIKEIASKPPKPYYIPSAFEKATGIKDHQ